MQPVSESETDEDPPQQMNLSALPDRIGFIGAGQVVFPLPWQPVVHALRAGYKLPSFYHLNMTAIQTPVQMGEALIRGFCKSGVSSVEQISVSVRRFDRQRALSAMGLRVYGDALEGGAADLAANSEIIFLGVRGPSVHHKRPNICFEANSICHSILGQASAEPGLRHAGSRATGKACKV